jgi:hypothetical protein
MVLRLMGGLGSCLNPGRCSWVGARKTVHWIVSWGPVQFDVLLAGWLQLVGCVYLCVGWWLLPVCNAPLCLRSPLELVFPPLELVLPPLECVLLVMPLGSRKLCCNWLWPLLPCFFAIAILVNSLLTFCNASAVSFPVGMFPWSTIVSCCAAATTSDSGETVWFVMYWCSKNTMSLIRFVLVFVMYTQKHW